MRRLRGLILLLCAACGTSGTATSERGGGSARGEARLVGEADYRVAQVVQADRAVAFQIGGSGDTAPPRLAKDLAAGHRWLSIDRPLGFSFVGTDLLEGRTVFQPARASVSLARVSETAGKVSSEPALVRLHGTIEDTVIAKQLEVLKEAGVVEQGLGSIDDENLRVLLGNGLDAILSMASPDQGGSRRWDSREWVNVVDGDGKAVPDWLDRFRQAIAAQSLDGVKDLKVVAARYRAHENPREVFFRFPAYLVGIGAQMKVTREGRTFQWVWEGLWRGGLGAQPAGAANPDWPVASGFTLHYKEYKPGRRQGGAWHTLLKPVTLPLNYAAKAFDPYADQRDDGGGWK